VVSEIQQAHSMLDGLLGAKIAPVAFAVALLASGQSSTVTGTLSGQVVMEGFLNLRMRAWLRRLITRGLALVPAVIVIALAGDRSVFRLLILSQVVLSLQLPFAIIPLLHFTSDRRKMGLFASSLPVRILGWLVAAVIVGLNLRLGYSVLGGWLHAAPAFVWGAVVLVALALLALLAFILMRPILRPGRVWESAAVTEGGALAAGLRPLAIRNIGVALEHTAGDVTVLSAAISQAKVYGARVTLVHVVDTPGVMMLGEESGGRHGSEDRAYLESLAREIETPDLAVEVDLRYGRAVEQIVRAADENGFDLLVVGSHGHRGIEDVIYGQTVSSVRHALRIPILIVRAPGREPAQHPNAPRREP
jgi:manganese transport protein